MIRALLLSSMIVTILTASASAQGKPHKKNMKEKSFRLSNPDTLAKPSAGYSQIAEVTGGKIVYIAGQVSLDKSGNLIGKDDLRAQAQQVFTNLKAAVEAAGGDTSDLVKLNIYVVESVNADQIPALRDIRDKFVNTANPPTSTFVVVKRLVRPEWLIEIDAVAVVQQK